MFLYVHDVYVSPQIEDIWWSDGGIYAQDLRRNLRGKGGGKSRKGRIQNKNTTAGGKLGPYSDHEIIPGTRSLNGYYIMLLITSMYPLFYELVQIRSKGLFSYLGDIKNYEEFLFLFSTGSMGIIH